MARQKLIEAKERAQSLRKEIKMNRLKELGFSSALEFVQYHWDKLLPEDREELKKAGVKRLEED